ncbi:cardiolipin synthase [Sphingomonas fennica]|uniref:Cardiolipin synthase n=1 Tax=Edaphosphingomonas fennica TaxID=114404 RepID=A0A2T4I720_9SPHN|nr:cardiolipin synthase [Sphingomonas fennica]PTD26354.1 cardiolipin synthase [Sphingomonas fennica]
MAIHDIPSLGESYYLVEWAIRLVMLVVVPFRRSPAATRSWLLLIFVLPLPGLLLFLAIGSPRFPRWRRERFHALDPFVAGLAARLDAEAPPGTMNEPEAATLARTLGHLPAVGGNAVEFIDDYDAVIDRLVEDIDAAKRDVRLLVYIFADDAVGQRVMAALARAVARGVACHVLFDPVGSHRWRRGTVAGLRAAGVEVRAALPFRLLRDRTRRDMRNHRKLFLIDGQVGFTGSQNIVAQDFRPGVTNRELVVRVTGPVVAEMTAVFLADWYLETERLLEDSPEISPAAGTATAQVLPSGADYRSQGFHTMLIWQIHRARHRVVLVTPYLIPDEDLLSALRTAVLRGVTVDLVVSAIVDQRLVHFAQSSYYDELLRSGVRIRRYRRRLLHAKNVAFDDRLAILGSSNIDIRSFELNEEVSLLLFDTADIARLTAIQQAYLAESDEVTLDQWRRRSGLRKFAENVARLVSPLL